MGKVIVAGAGPVGSTAARHAAEAGASVLLYEEHKEIGRPAQCSGLVSKKALDSIGIGYKKAILNSIRGAYIYVNGSRLCVQSKEEKAFALDRPLFDALCAERAEKEGARLILGKRAPLSGSEPLIGADGVFSPTARHFKFPPHSRTVCCFQAEYSNASPESADMVSVYISKTHAPGFFAWVIPIGEGKVRAGLGVANGMDPKKHFDWFAKSLSSSVLLHARETSRLAGFIPLSPREKTVLGNVMLVGDAAGQVKALSGGGIYFGCTCAKIAGRVAAGGRNPEEYEREWKKEFSRDFALHGALRRTLDVVPDLALGGALYAGKLLGVERFLVKYGDMDRPTEVGRAVKERLFSRKKTF